MDLAELLGLELLLELVDGRLVDLEDSSLGSSGYSVLGWTELQGHQGHQGHHLEPALEPARLQALGGWFQQLQVGD